MSRREWVVSLWLLATACGDPETRPTDAGVTGSDGAVDASARVDGSAGDAATPMSHAERLARAAVSIGSCWPDDGVNRNLEYMWETDLIPRLWGRTVEQAECLATATNGCDALGDCLGWSMTPTTVACPPSCAGAVFRGCFDSLEFTIDCSTMGLMCDEIAICAPAPATACDRASFTPGCDADGRPLTCDDGAVWTSVRCSDYGLACDGGRCQGAGASCTGGDDRGGWVVYEGLSCEGDTLHACVGGGEATRDCASVAPGFRCQETTARGFTTRFCGLASECHPGDSARATCDDERTIAICNAGRIDRVDCTTLGFSSCDAGRCM